MFQNLINPLKREFQESSVLSFSFPSAFSLFLAQRY